MSRNFYRLAAITKVQCAQQMFPMKVTSLIPWGLLLADLG